MGGDGEQGPRQLRDPRLGEVLDILRRQQHRRIFLPHPLHEVSDVLDGGEVGEEQIELVDGGHGAALGEQLVAEKGQDAEQQGIFHAAAGLEQTLHPKHQEAVGGDVGVAVEKPALRADAHGPQTQQNLLEQFFRVQ